MDRSARNKFHQNLKREVVTKPMPKPSGEASKDTLRSLAAQAMQSGVTIKKIPPLRPSSK